MNLSHKKTNFGRIKLILDLENWHWKLKMAVFWQPLIKHSYKISWMLILMQKSIEFHLPNYKISQLSSRYCAFLNSLDFLNLILFWSCHLSKAILIIWVPHFDTCNSKMQGFLTTTGKPAETQICSEESANNLLDRPQKAQFVFHRLWKCRKRGRKNKIFDVNASICWIIGE